MNDKIEKLINWLEKQIIQCERKIDKGGPFYELQTEKEAYEKTLEKIYS
uniref:Uncharacterized protein n=1 Tax=viral metagenome TaxID=1070528 RepID=A0A6H1ZZF2_9ZZZZ